MFSLDRAEKTSKNPTEESKLVDRWERVRAVQTGDDKKCNEIKISDLTQ